MLSTHWVVLYTSQCELPPLADRADRFGDGLFETLLWSGRELVLLDYHRDRLQQGVDRLELDLAQATIDAFWTEVTHRLRELVPFELAAVRVSCHRVSQAPGYSTEPQEPAYLSCLVKSQAHSTQRSMSLSVSSIRLAIQPALAGVKHMNRLEQVLASRELAQTTGDDAIMLDTAGHVVCTTRANLWGWIDGQWRTPLLHRCGVRGTRRQWLMNELSEELGVEVVECDLTLAQLLEAEELMISNALLGFVSVSAVDGQNFSVGKQTQRVADAYHRLVSGS